MFSKSFELQLKLMLENNRSKDQEKIKTIKKYLNVSIFLSIILVISFIVLMCFIPSIIRTFSYQKDNIIEVECPDITINDNHICRKVNPYKRYEGYSYNTSGNYMRSYMLWRFLKNHFQ